MYDTPKIMIFSENYSDEGELYSGTMKMGPIANAAARKMQSFVSFVSNSNYDSFVDRDRMK